VFGKIAGTTAGQRAKQSPWPSGLASTFLAHGRQVVWGPDKRAPSRRAKSSVTFATNIAG
jgi:hypothetical protein